MKKKVIKVGILSQEAYKKRTIAIAKGEYMPKRGEPKIWFDSIQTFAQVFSNDNQELLKFILSAQPHSIEELAEVTGRQFDRISEALDMMARYGIVEFAPHDSSKMPLVKATDFKLEFGVRQLF